MRIEPVPDCIGLEHLRLEKRKTIFPANALEYSVNAERSSRCTGTHVQLRYDCLCHAFSRDKRANFGCRYFFVFRCRCSQGHVNFPQTA